MTKFVSYQPQYFPRLHYFARILDSDIFGVADYLQFVRKHEYEKEGSSVRGPSYQAHAPIKTASGVLLLDIPTKHGGLKTINETMLGFSSQKERLRNLRIIEAHYRSAPQFTSVFPKLKAFFERSHASVGEINIGSIALSLGILLGLEAAGGVVLLEEVHAALATSQFRLRRIVPFSETPILPSDKEGGRDANDWLVDACRHFDADEYSYGGTAAGAYMDFSKFERAGIRLVQQDWKLQPYQQLHGDFLPNLSIIDLLMNVEPAEARRILSA